MEDITMYTDRELSLIVYNDEYWYNMRHSEGLYEHINNTYKYTDKQLNHLKETIKEESDE